MFKGQHNISAYYPYECGEIVGPKSAIDMTPAMEAWRDELCAEAGVKPNNKITFELYGKYDETLAVQFWDWTVYIGHECRAKQGATYLELDENGGLVKKRSHVTPNDQVERTQKASRGENE